MELHNKLVEAQMELGKLQIKYDELVAKTVDERVDFATSQAAGWWQKFMGERELNDRYRANHAELVEELNQMRLCKYALKYQERLCNDERFYEQWTDLLMLMKLAEPGMFAEYEHYRKKCDDTLNRF